MGRTVLGGRLPRSTSVKSRPQPLKKAAGPAPAEDLGAQSQALSGAAVAGASPVQVQTQGRALALQPELQSQGRILTTERKVATAQRTVGSAGGSPPQPGEAAIAALATETFRNRLARAVRYGHELWRLQARFRQVSIQAVTAIGAPGCLAGPSLAPFVGLAPEVVGVAGLERELVDAVGEGVGECLGQWQDGVMVPGLPWYPAFAAWPGPHAPPTPNVPMPLLACPSTRSSMVTASDSLRREMVEALPDPLRAPRVEAMLGSLAQCLALYFTVWLAGQQVMLVMGTGPVPSYSPPYVPAGPVIGGRVIEAPGHLAQGALPAVPLLPYAA